MNIAVNLRCDDVGQKVDVVSDISVVGWAVHCSKNVVPSRTLH